MPKKRLTAVLMGAGGNMRGAHLPRIAADGAVWRSWASRIRSSPRRGR